MKALVPTYPCTMQELYLVARTGWGPCRAQLAKFSALKPKYTGRFIDERLWEIDDAEALPAFEERNDECTTQYLHFERATVLALANWQVLKTYIVDGYEGEVQVKKLRSAGLGYYKRAAGGKTDALLNVLSLGSSFIQKNKSELVAKNVMPDTFERVYNDGRDDCLKARRDYVDTRQDTGKETDEKLLANNAVYDKFAMMCKDGQRIFLREPVLKKSFVIRDLLTLVGRGGVAGFKLTIKNSVTKMPLADVQVFDSTGEYAGVSNSKGKVAWKRMAAGTYTFTLSLEGFAPVMLTVTLMPRKTKQMTRFIGIDN